jgi:hypothetical protein
MKGMVTDWREGKEREGKRREKIHETKGGKRRENKGMGCVKHWDKVLDGSASRG